MDFEEVAREAARVVLADTEDTLHNRIHQEEGRHTFPEADSRDKVASPDHLAEEVEEDRNSTWEQSQVVARHTVAHSIGLAREGDIQGMLKGEHSHPGDIQGTKYQEPRKERANSGDIRGRRMGPWKVALQGPAK